MVIEQCQVRVAEEMNPQHLCAQIKDVVEPGNKKEEMDREHGVTKNTQNCFVKQKSRENKTESKR